MFQHVPEFTAFFNSLGWAMLHSLWQGLLVFCCLRIVFKLSPQLSANAKYWLAYSSLVILSGWFVFNVMQQWNLLQQTIVKITESGTTDKVIYASADTASVHAAGSPWLLRIESAFPWLSVLYIAGIVVLTVRLAVNMIQAQLLKTRNLLPVPECLQLRFDQLTEQMLGNPVRLFLSHRVTVPSVIGHIRPVILLPVAAIARLSADQLEAILLHELAHIRRNDYLLNVFQTFLETILFFNPFTWLISRLVRKEREHCCDDEVLACAQPMPYAQALATLEEEQQPGRLTLAATGHQHHHLFHRIKRIIEMKKQKTNYGQLSLVLLLTAMFAVSIAWFQPSFGQSKNKDEQKKEKTHTQKITKEYKREKVIVIDDAGKKKVYEHREDMPEEMKEKLDKALKHADVATMNADEALKMADKMLKDIDVHVITKNIADGMEHVDWEEISAEIKKAMEELDSDKIKADVAIALNHVDWDEIHKEVEKGMAEAREELKDAKAKMNIVIAGDKDDADITVLGSGTKAGSVSFDKMLDEMEDAGLISRKEGFTIDKKNDQLYINNHLQPDAVFHQFSKYLNKGKKVKISGDEHTLNISIQN